MARKAHYVLSTHWDREWYQTFQDFRYRLVRLLDHVLAGWEREELQGPFQTDGQAILLEDYLEVRPEREAQVRALVEGGRFIVGPWYVLPDEFLVSGESLVRNLRLGRETARRLGASPSDAGFLCDMFGHNSQMPQILAGFSIRDAFLWRGINQVEQRLFRWRGADGSEMPSFRFGRVGYCSFASQVRGASPHVPRPDASEVGARLNAFLQEEDAATETGPLLLFDGCDHMEWDADVYKALVRRFNEEKDGFEIIHSSLDGYLDGLLAGLESRPISTVVEGELREPALHPGNVDAQWLIPGVTSSRVRIKQANARCQDLLCQWAEPMSAFAAWTVGQPYPQGFLDVAWRWLLQNHPHDSICGCSIDAVHEDMMYRFHQCEQIANRLTLESTRRILARVMDDPAEGSPAGAMRVAVFNPLSRPFHGVADLALDIPADWPWFSEMMGTFEPRPAFRIFDPSGQEIPYQRTGQAMRRTRLSTFDITFPTTHLVNEVHVSLPLDVPAMGYTTLFLRAERGGAPVRFPEPPALARSDRVLENETLTVTVDPAGTLSITDRRSGQNYSHLLTFEDCADIGDGWNFGPAVNDQIFYAPAGRTSLALVANGPYRATLRLRTVMELPEQFHFDTMTRSASLTPLVIESLVTLRAGSDWVEVETTVHNAVKDHRLRVLFPSGAQADTCLMDTPFDVVERPIALREDNYRYRELEVETRPQQTFTAVCDGQRGLAVISSGLLECAVQDLPDRPLALTLLRATRRTVNTDGEPGGQEQGELRYRFWIAPLSGEPDHARLLELGQSLSAGQRSVQLTPTERAFLLAEPGSKTPLAPSASFFAVEGPLVLTSLRQVGDALEARLFNPDVAPVEALLVLAAWQVAETAGTVERVNLESYPTGQVYPVEDGRVRVMLGPKEIATFAFRGDR